MDEISNQLLYQRLRNRVIELLELYSTFEDIAQFGSFETIEKVFDWLPIDFDIVPLVFSEQEKETVIGFIRLVGEASDATQENTWDVDYFRSSKEWCQLRHFAESALQTFLARGRFSEDEEVSLH